MPSRIIFCALSCGAALMELTHQRLHQLDTGVVVTVSDDVAVQLLSSTQPGAVGILYWSTDSYQDAIRGLSSPDVIEVIQKRLVDWSPRAHEYALGQIFSDQRRVLAVTASALVQADDTRRREMIERFRQTLHFTASVASTGRYHDMAAADLLTVIAEKEALLREELRLLPKTAGINAELHLRERMSASIYALLKELGRPAFSQAAPVANPERGVLISPLDDDLRRALNENSVTWTEWSGHGAVAALRMHRVQSLRNQGKRVQTLFASPLALYEAFVEGTRAQLVRRFETLATTAGQRERDHQTEEYCNTLRLEISIMSHALVSRTTDARIQVVLKNREAAEYPIIAAELARTRSWHLSVDAGDLASLLRAETAVVDDAAFLSAVARLRSQTHLADHLAVILTQKKADVASVPRLFGR